MQRSLSTTPVLKLGALPLLWLLAGPVMAVSAPLLESNVGVTKEGYFRLSWHSAGDDAVGYRLEQARSGDFDSPVVVYEGMDRAAMMTGKSDGAYYFRVGAVVEPSERIQWSNPVMVEVKHHSLGSAMLVFAAGLVVFVATSAVIVTAALRSKGNEST